MTEICPEKGLTHQHFRCARCNRALNKQQIHVEARVCDYSGLYYCPACHKRDQAIIPARVLHNWDFTPRTVQLHTHAHMYTHPCTHAHAYTHGLTCAHSCNNVQHYVTLPGVLPVF